MPSIQDKLYKRKYVFTFLQEPGSKYITVIAPKDGDDDDGDDLPARRIAKRICEALEKLGSDLFLIEAIGSDSTNTMTGHY